MEQDKEILTTTECADLLQVKHRTVVRWIKIGKIRALHLGREFRVKKESLLQDLEYQPTNKEEASA